MVLHGFINIYIRGWKLCVLCIYIKIKNYENYKFQKQFYITYAYAIRGSFKLKKSSESIKKSIMEISNATFEYDQREIENAFQNKT